MFNAPVADCALLVLITSHHTVIYHRLGTRHPPPTLPALTHPSTKLIHEQLPAQIVAAHRMKKGTAGRQAMLPAKADGQRTKTTENMKKSLGAMGIDTSLAEARMRSESRGRKRERSRSAARGKSTGGLGCCFVRAVPLTATTEAVRASLARWFHSYLTAMQALVRDAVLLLLAHFWYL